MAALKVLKVKLQVEITGCPHQFWDNKLRMLVTEAVYGI